jgi:4-amino-4-deoxy-L-arabinose transferase-like glycosyltransferase
VLAVALAARLALVAYSPRAIQWVDGREFEAVARSLLEHHTYGTQTLRPPGYPTFVAAVYGLLGPDLVRLRIVEAVVGTVTVGVIGAVGASLFGAPAGLAAAALTAIKPVLMMLPTTQYSENLLLLVVALAFAAAFAAWRRGGLGRWALAGALFGLGLLIRPNTVLLLPGLAAGFALVLRRERRGWRRPLAVAAVATLLVVTPWIVRNHQVHHRWFFVATGGGRQFWFGNNPRTSGAPNLLTLPDPAMQQELARLPDDAARERYLYRRGFEFVRQHPLRAARLYLVKLGNLFALTPTTISHTVFTRPWGRGVEGLGSAVVFLGVLLALRRVRRTPALWPLLGGIVTYALANAVFFTVMRYRLAVEPCLLWMSGLGWAGLLGRRRVTR